MSLSGFKLSIFFIFRILRPFLVGHFVFYCPVFMCEFVVGLPLSSAPSLITVLCIGHSHIAWLRTYVEAADWFAGFVIRGHPCNVEFLGLRCWSTLETLLAPTMMDLAYIIVIHVGGNDLDARSYPNPVMVAIDIQRLSLRWLGCKDGGSRVFRLERSELYRLTGT